MNFLKRLYLLILTVALIAVVVLFLLAPGSVNGWTGSIMEAPVLLRVLVALVVALLLGALTTMQIRGERRNRMSGLMMRAGGAITEVSVDSARGRILKAVSDLPDVASAEAQINPVRGRADIEMQVTVFGHDVNLPAKQKEINRALNQVLNKQLGLRLAGRPRVHIQIYGEQPKPTPTPELSPASAQPGSGGLIGGLLGGLRRETPASDAPAAEVPPAPAVTLVEAESAVPVERERVGTVLGAWRREVPVDEPAMPADEPVSAPDGKPSDLDASEVKLDDFQPIKLDSELAESPTSDFVGDDNDIDEELGVKRSVRDVGDMPDDDAVEGKPSEVPAKD
ncbi:MAG: hypothetical protein JNJ61_13580 [Anaerolineae bacterium]|nr:hypothetical protein [Anaerolineae bacterium]